MIFSQPDPTRSERHLLASLHWWGRHNGWRRLDEGWSNFELFSSDTGVVAVRPWVVDGDVYGVEVRKARAGDDPACDYGWWPPNQIRADSVVEAVDLLVAYGVLPPFWSSAYGLAEDKCQEEIQLLGARVHELESMLAAADSDAGRSAYAAAMEYLR